jgi:hypothetical protein
MINRLTDVSLFLLGSFLSSFDYFLYWLFWLFCFLSPPCPIDGPAFPLTLAALTPALDGSFFILAMIITSVFKKIRVTLFYDAQVC